MWFSYMVILEASEYHRYKTETTCTKPFGLFWICHFTSILMFRLFCYLEKYCQYRFTLALFERDVVSVRRARLLVVTMMCCKLLAFWGFLIFTIIGSVWLVQDGRCLSKLDGGANNRAEIKMAFWLSVSFIGCMIYITRIIKWKIFEGAPREFWQGDDDGQIRIFMRADLAPRQEGRTLTEGEINAIKKSKLRDYDELRWSAKTPSRLSNQIPNELDNSDTLELTSPLDDRKVLNEIELKRDEEEQSQCTCAICLEDIEIGEWYKKLPKCEHTFHAPCIDQWLSTRATCPVCREEILLDETSLDDPVAGRSNPPPERVFLYRETHIVLGGSDSEPRVFLRLSRV